MLAGDLINRNDTDSRPAIVYGDEVWSYGDLDRTANQFARMLCAAGLGPGDRVSLLVGNDPYLVAAYLGAFRCGLVANPLNTRLTAGELAYVIGHAGSAWIITDGEHADLARQALDRLPEGQARPGVTTLRDATDPLQGVPTDPQPAHGFGQDDGALLIYTSGTTGKPKGVLLTHRNVCAAVHIVREAFEMTPADVTMCVMPLFHTNALMFSTLPFLSAGARVILRRRFSASRFWDECLQHGVTSGSASPTILAMLLAHEANAPPKGRTGLKYMKVASAPTPVSLAERFEARFGEGLLLETYGLTETTAILTMNPLHGQRVFGSIGKVLPPQELRIADTQGQDVAAGDIGEILVRGPTIMTGYFHDPDNTQRAFHGDWLQTGDMARQDERGFVTIVGRRKELIVRGGENISPLEVEDCVLQLPAVREAAAVGVPDELWGEVVGLCVVLEDSTLTEDALLAHCREHLSPFKVPQRIHIVQELPRNAMGKVLRPRLRDVMGSPVGSS